MSKPEITGFEVTIALLLAVGESIPCLFDWVKSTGYGEVNARDKKALRACLEALDKHSQLCKQAGVDTPGSAAYPEIIAYLKHYS